VVAAILVKSLRIDDPLDSSAVHYFCGCWGVLAPGFFAVPSLMNLAYRQNRTGNEFGGVFYGGSGVQLGVQVCCPLITSKKRFL
jgi:Amt family ammonium transporter